MPYRRKGKTVQVKKRGRWVKKATASSVSAAERMLKLLRGLKAGTLKKRKKL